MAVPSGPTRSKSKRDAGGATARCRRVAASGVACAGTSGRLPLMATGYNSALIARSAPRQAVLAQQLAEVHAVHGRQPRGLRHVAVGAGEQVTQEADLERLEGTGARLAVAAGWRTGLGARLGAVHHG